MQWPIRKIPLLTHAIRTFFLALAGSAILFGCDSNLKDGPRITSYSHLHKIGTAIRDYTDDHGTRPQQLSDLVPRYIQFDQIGIFYVTSETARNTSAPSDWASNPSRINQYSAYVYLGTNTMRDILAFERLDLWKPSGDRALEVAVLFSDYHVQYIPKVKLQELIPETARVQK